MYNVPWTYDEPKDAYWTSVAPSRAFTEIIEKIRRQEDDKIREVLIEMGWTPPGEKCGECR